MQESMVSELGSELMRIGSVLRLNPANPDVAFREPKLQLPVLLAVMRTGDADSLLPALINESEIKSLGDGIGQIRLTITYKS